MANIIDYQAREPRKRFNLSTATTIPHTGSRLTLATFQLNTGMGQNMARNKVELVATVGVRGVTGISQLVFRIFRDGTQIFNSRQGVESSGSERNYAVSLQAIDTNVSGTHTYTLTVENRTAGTTARVVGPVSFSGLSTRR